MFHIQDPLILTFIRFTYARSKYVRPAMGQHTTVNNSHIYIHIKTSYYIDVLYLAKYRHSKETVPYAPENTLLHIEWYTPKLYVPRGTHTRTQPMWGIAVVSSTPTSSIIQRRALSTLATCHCITRKHSLLPSLFSTRFRSYFLPYADKVIM